jgi:hypothetical protein
MDKVGFFQSAPGRWSSTRLQAFLAFLSALALVFTTAFSSTVSFGESFPMVITLLAYSLGIKTFQNITEKVSK